LTGVHCRRYVTTHGLALNNTVDLKWYENIVPCGIQDKGVTSISQELGQDLPMETVRSQFLQSFQIMFKCQLAEFDRDSLAEILSTIENVNEFSQSVAIAR
jgi:lipoyl(octanoyl) transferase